MIENHLHKKFIFITIICTVITVTTIFNVSNTLALSKFGSRGAEVKTIQTKLKSWGYYTGGIDGIYGTKTVEAVKYFQKKNGLTVDGIAGPKTLSMIGISASSVSSGSSSAGSFTSNEVTLLGRLITGEARGESYEGQVAVGGVIMNRLRNPNFPNTIAGVIYQPGAFTAITDGQVNVPVNAQCLKAAKDALNGWDPSGGAIYYYNPAKTTNKWIYSRPVIKRIGNHVFAK